MRALVQRVSRARVLIEGRAVGAIGRGLLVLVGVAQGDGPEDAAWIEKKALGLRIFEDEAGKMNLSVLDVAGSLLVVSQFTLCADTGRGQRPSFTGAMGPEGARAMLEAMIERWRAALPVETGTFGADMEVELVNQGPVTLWLDSRARS